MKSHIDRKFTVLPLLDLERERNGWSGKNLKKKEESLSQMVFPLIDCIFADQNLFTCPHDIGYMVHF